MPQYTVELVIRELFDVEAESGEEAIREAISEWELGNLVDLDECEWWLEEDDQD